MKRRARDAEPIVLAAVAAVPLYFTAALAIGAVALYHLTLGAILLARSRDPEFALPQWLLRTLAIAYLVFFPVDGIALSHSLIRATGHLLFFIAAYQAVDHEAEGNLPQRLLVTYLIAIASIATATHISIVLFVAAFAYLLLLQLIQISHEESARIAGAALTIDPAGRTAAGYLALMVAFGAALFPLLPRVRDPFVRGPGIGGQASSTGFSDSIDLTSGSSITPDPRVVARVTMNHDAIPLLTPLRLRGGHYDRYIGGRWTSRAMRTASRVVATDGALIIARPAGSNEGINIQQTRTGALDQRLFLPVGTWQIQGLSSVIEGPNEGSYMLPGRGEALVTFDVTVSPEVTGLEEPKRLPSYEVGPAIQRLASIIAANASTPRENAAKIESYLSTRYQYVPSPDPLGKAVGAEDFLLAERKGHCEHFAAGMVLLLAARGVPARVVGGYYGGELNPLTGYFVIRQSDAHAWVEVWDQGRWRTYDPTPADLRPGAARDNILLSYLSALSESVNFFWDRYILTFGMSDQVNLILRAFYGVRDVVAATKLRLGFVRGLVVTPGAILALLLFSALAILVLHPLRIRRSLFDRLTARLARAGVRIEPSMTTDEIVARVERLQPSLARPVRAVVDYYRRERFAEETPAKEERDVAVAALREIRAG